jgi:large subunit ribosomal protein L24
MHVKKGQKVKILSGADKGKIGKVLKVFPKSQKIVVEGVNVKKKHQRPSRSNQKGQILEKFAPIFASKVRVIE